MRKKLTLWGALCLIMVCMIQMTVSAATTVTISQCIISGANQVTEQQVLQQRHQVMTTLLFICFTAL